MMIEFSIVGLKLQTVSSTITMFLILAYLLTLLEHREQERRNQKNGGA